MIRTVAIERWALFRRLLPNDVYLWLKAFLLAGIAVQSARLLWAIVTPVGPYGEWRPARARMLPQQAQAAILAAVDPFFRNAATAVQQEAPSLDLQLFGTREDRAAGGGSAIIGAPDGEQRSYAVGQEVAPGVRLAAVHFDFVVLDRGGRQEKLMLDSGDGAGEGPDPLAAAARTDSSGGALTAASIHQAISFKPRSIRGRVTGVTVGPGSNESLFAASGFQAGDVIVAVNGARISSPTDLAQLQKSFVPGARLSFTVERGGQAVPIAINLAGNP